MPHLFHAALVNLDADERAVNLPRLQVEDVLQLRSVRVWRLCGHREDVHDGQDFELGWSRLGAQCGSVVIMITRTRRRREKRTQLGPNCVFEVGLSDQAPLSGNSRKMISTRFEALGGQENASEWPRRRSDVVMAGEVNSKSWPSCLIGVVTSQLRGCVAEGLSEIPIPCVLVRRCPTWTDVGLFPLWLYRKPLVRQRDRGMEGLEV